MQNVNILYKYVPICCRSAISTLLLSLIEPWQVNGKAKWHLRELIYIKISDKYYPLFLSSLHLCFLVNTNDIKCGKDISVSYEVFILINYCWGKRVLYNDKIHLSVVCRKPNFHSSLVMHMTDEPDSIRTGSMNFASSILSISRFSYSHTFDLL